MTLLGVLLRKELHAAFTSPVAYAIGAVFLLVMGYTFSLTLFFTKVANLTYIFHQMYVLLVLLTPVLTMRAFAEERRTDTLELLLTAPVPEIAIVGAKFLASLALITAMLAASIAYPVVLWLYGHPDWAPIYGGYLALVLLSCLLVSVGMLTSSLTENQVVAAATSLGIFLMLWFADSAAYLAPAPLDTLFINLSLIGHFTTFVRGSLFLSDAGYYVTLSLFSLFVTTRALADR
ncbi:MAG: ABC transporter permease [Candidatus Rokuibacteriota bacterium]|nr:MAG: ABC transporter permease [Candidatus Rokubacteria bacterium]